MQRPFLISIPLLLATCTAQAAPAHDTAEVPASEPAPAEPTAGALVPVADFGPNPGALAMYKYVPEGLPEGSPLVVVLHGCIQGARDMLPAGWNQLADELGFAVVYPETNASNNPVRCFNWAGEHGDPANLVRGRGENQSIVSMVETMKEDHGVDASRVYVTGFSAGGAMTAVLLATWPDVFSGGAILSGVPYRCATTVQGAYDCQQLGYNPERKREPGEWGDLVRAAVPEYDGPYPRVSIWHGDADTFIVHHENAGELVDQWTDVHGIDQIPATSEELEGNLHTTFERDGQVVVERYVIRGMGHAVSYSASDPAYPCQPSGFAQYFADGGLCSTYRIAEFFGLTGAGGDGGGDGDGDGGGDGGGDGDGDGDGECELPHAAGLGAGPAACSAGGGGGLSWLLLLAIPALRSARSRSRRPLWP